MAQAISTPSKPQTLDAIVHCTVGQPAVLLSCEKSLGRLPIRNDIAIANAVRESWTCRPLTKKHPPKVAICHDRGIVVKVYRDLNWYPTAAEHAKRLAWSLGYIRSVMTMLHPGVVSEDQLEKMSTLMQGVAHRAVREDAPEWCFTGNEAPEYANLVGLDLSEFLTQRGMANPVRYVNCD